MSTHYVTTTILHEIVHSVTVNALNNPQTPEEVKFA
nr:MAG TPA: metallopeptidase toxin 3 [Caudoviricetes sp.]